MVAEFQLPCGYICRVWKQGVYVKVDGKPVKVDYDVCPHSRAVNVSHFEGQQDMWEVIARASSAATARSVGLRMVPIIGPVG